MISWIKGETVCFWENNNKYFVLINCKGLGYEIQILKSIYTELKTKKISDKNLNLWLKHIKKEDSDTLYGFSSKKEKDFFVEILNIKGVGAQIGMALLNKFSIDEFINAINAKNKQLISSIPGVGQKMTERIILELKNNKITESCYLKETRDTTHSYENSSLNETLQEISLALQSLSYPKKDIKNIFPLLLQDIKNNKLLTHGQKDVSFENLFKKAMVYLDNHDSNLGQ